MINQNNFFACRSLKSFFVISLLLLLSSSLFAQKSKVAMLDFSGSSLSVDDAESLIGLFTSEFTKYDYRDHLTVLARSETALKKAYGELKFQRYSMLEESQIGQIGKQLGADFVFYGVVARFGSRVTVTASVLHVETVEVIGSVTSTLPTLYDIDSTKVARELVAEMVGVYRIGPGSGYSSSSSSNPSIALSQVLDAHKGAIGVSTITSILKKGDINGRGNGGNTALMLAARNGHYEIVRALIDAGANVNIKSGSTSALSLASQYRHHNIVRLLKDSGAR